MLLFSNNRMDLSNKSRIKQQMKAKVHIKQAISTCDVRPVTTTLTLYAD